MAPCPKAASLPTLCEKGSEHDAFDLRQRSDYAAEFHALPEEAKITLTNAESFVVEVKKVLLKEV